MTLKCSPSPSSSARRWMVKLPHCVLLAWNLPPSTCRYRVLRTLEHAACVALAFKKRFLDR